MEKLIHLRIDQFNTRSYCSLQGSDASGQPGTFFNNQRHEQLARKGEAARAISWRATEIQVK
jgi:hypothetical protein